MKKLLFLVAFLAGLASATHAQKAVTLPLAAGDTITNTGTASKVIELTSGPSGIAVQVVLTKLSGTGAGTVVLQGCNDGVNYTAIGSAFTITNVTTQSTMFYVAAPVPRFVKVLATGSGTESVVQTVIYRAPRYQAP
ncbi:hypothetical protein [Puia sp.]|jgi:hypothetical protein|uniref:hypothetical protein n=1 Tax=Puia sp. TaxID=2045100 RepID=UPI002F3F9B02